MMGKMGGKCNSNTDACTNPYNCENPYTFDTCDPIIEGGGCKNAYGLLQVAQSGCNGIDYMEQ